LAQKISTSDLGKLLGRLPFARMDLRWTWAGRESRAWNIRCDSAWDEARRPAGTHIYRCGFDRGRPDEYNKSMTTMTLKEAQTNLGELCQRAKNGEDVGIVSGRQVLRLVPTKVNRQNALVLIPMTGEYVAKEYGVAPAEFGRFKKRLDRRYREEKSRGMIKRFSGDIEKDIQD
jgi:antitoxin (DNA-binding transcriptional repressor) of toxin-antitoxin stability system